MRPGRPVRVLHVVRRYEPLVGGTERYVKDLAEAQARAGREVTVLTLDHDVTHVRVGRLVAREMIAGTTIVRLPGIGNPRFATTSRPHLAARAVARADVVHLHDLRFLLGLAATVRGLQRRPLLVHTHGLLFHTTWALGWKQFLIRTYFGPLLRLSGARILASSESDRMALLALTPYLHARTETMENAVGLEGLIGLERVPIAGRVLALGRIASSKRLDTLLQALASVRDKPWTLVVAGAPEPVELERLQRLATSLGIEDRLTFIGPFDDPASLLSVAELAAFPSPGEGFGITLLEAMAAGVPVVANDIPAHRALLGPDLADRLADFGDPAAAAAALSTTLELSPEKRAVLSDAERKRARLYDLPRLCGQIDALYRSLGLDG